MIFTRAQLDTLSWEELVEKLMKYSNIADEDKILANWFDVFVGKYDKLPSEAVKNFKEFQFLISQSDYKPRKKRFVQWSIYEKRNVRDKSCSLFNKKCWP